MAEEEMGKTIMTERKGWKREVEQRRSRQSVLGRTNEEGNQAERRVREHLRGLIWWKVKVSKGTVTINQTLKTVSTHCQFVESRPFNSRTTECNRRLNELLCWEYIFCTSSHSHRQWLRFSRWWRERLNQLQNASTRKEQLQQTDGVFSKKSLAQYLQRIVCILLSSLTVYLLSTLQCSLPIAHTLVTQVTWQLNSLSSSSYTLQITSSPTCSKILLS